MRARGVVVVLFTAALTVGAALALRPGARLTAVAAPAAPPICTDATAYLTADYAYAVGGAGFSDADGDAEAGSTFRWLADGVPAASGPVTEGLLLHFDVAATGVNGEAPVSSQGVAYAAGRFGSALQLAADGRLRYPTANNLSLTEGTWELWIAPRADGSDPIYSSTWHVLIHYEAPNGDSLFIAQSGDTGVIYAGGDVGGQWQSAYNGNYTTRSWRASEWHHVAFTFSQAGNFMRFYLDGRLIADTNEDHYWPPSVAGTTFTVGGTPWNTAAAYWLDEVRVSGRVADAAEIAARASRSTAARPNEIWLPTAGLAPGSSLVFEFTPAAGGQTGSPCASAPLIYTGIPITDPQPPNTLLPAGATSFDLSVETPTATTCAWAVGPALPFEQMMVFDSDSGQIANGKTQYAPRTTQHATRITGLTPDPNTLNAVTIRCAAQPDYLLRLQYRSLSVANPPFPRTGNLWGWWNFVDQGLPYLARIDLWLGADGLSGEQIRQLRLLNPHIRVLTSINAVENAGLPDDYYLKDVNGAKIEVWPGSYRLNLTKLTVAEYQARFAYESWLASGLQADGVFFDNVMTTQSWLTHDIYGDPVQIDADGDGVEDDPAVLDAAWRAGVFHEIATFRQLMPGAIVNGHSLNVYEPGIAALFNGVSIGFGTANVLEGEETFTDLWSRYHAWLDQALRPPVTMIESSPVDQIAYGYDYEPLTKIPPATLDFGRTYYPWMRFGLALTLMDDGYFAHEFGDTWHGNDWWYDELDADLGYPLGPAQRAEIGFDPGPNLVENGGFETPITSPWSFWASSGDGCIASVTRDATTAAEGNASARVTITATSGTDWHVEFSQRNRSLTAGISYDLAFWAKADITRTITLSSQRGSPPWTNYGLWGEVTAGPAWQPITVTFEANATVSDARIQFLAGALTGTVWLDDVRLTRHPPDVFRREFDNGLVLLNGTRAWQRIAAGAGFARLIGTQAPKYETILDDAGPGFSVISGSWAAATYDSGEWQAAGPFYHDWSDGVHQASAAGQVYWSLPISATDVYTVTAWWPAAPAAAGWNAVARFEIVAGGQVVAAATLDQRTGGDEWHTIGAATLAPGDGAYVRLVCDAAAPCVADALHLRSWARYNDGSPAGDVALAPLDGIVLRRVPAVAPAIYLPLILGGALQLNWMPDSANCRYDVYRASAPYFTPDAATLLAVNLPAGTGVYTDTTAHLNDPAEDDFYLVRAFGCDGLSQADSARVGCVEFGLAAGTSP